MVDDFGVKYTNTSDASHLITALEQSYTIKADWTGTKYIGIDLKWDYEKREVTSSMKKYVANALKQFQHPMPTKACHGTTKHTQPECGQKVQ